MADIIPFQQADFGRVLARIRELWETGEVVILPHAKQRMAERGLDELDVQNIIRGGRVTQQTMNRFKVVGKSVEERKTACVVTIEKTLLVITVVDETQSRRSAQ